jgi:hypothetical protein
LELENMMCIVGMCERRREGKEGWGSRGRKRERPHGSNWGNLYGRPGLTHDFDLELENMMYVGGMCERGRKEGKEGGGRERREGGGREEGGRREEGCSEKEEEGEARLTYNRILPL